MKFEKYTRKNLRGTLLNQYKTDLAKKGLNQIQQEILIGTLFLRGDASMQAMKETQESNIKFEQKIDKKEYIDHLYENFHE